MTRAFKGDFLVSFEAGALVEPSGSGLVGAGPSGPVLRVAWWPGPGGGGGQAADFGDGEPDHARVGWRCLAGTHQWWRLAVRAVLEQGGDDGADGQGSHD